MPTTTKPTTAVCPSCSLEVDLVRGKIKDHPNAAAQKSGTRRVKAGVCPGSGAKPAPPAADDASTVATSNGSTEATVVAPTLDLSLLEANRPAGAWSGAEAATIDPNLCDPDPHNPRGTVGDVSELALSLVAQGMLEPVIVAPGPTDGRYTIVAGHRRVAAAVAANLPEIPALVRSDLQPGSNLSLAAQVVENLHRLPFTPLEEANAYDLLRQLGMKQTDIATAVGVNQGQVSKRLALLKLPADLASTVGTDGGLDIADAVELTRLPAAAKTRALTDIERGADPERAIRLAKAAAERDAEHQTLVDDLEARHVALVDFPTSWYWTRDREDRPLATGPDGERQNYAGARTLDVPYVDHADLPCHGAAVSPRDEVIYVCLDPTRHGYPSIEQENAADEADRARLAEEREAAEAAKAASLDARHQAARTAALADVKRPYMTDAIAAWALDALAFDEVYVEGIEVIDQLLAWSDLERDENMADAGWYLEQLVAQHGQLRLAYMAAVAGADLLVDAPPYYRAQVPSRVFAGHFARLTELAGYEPTDADQTLTVPPVDDRPALPEGEPPAGALAWYDPDADALLEGDEGRWITDPGELEAISTERSDRLILVDQPTAPDALELDSSPEPGRTKEENAAPDDEAVDDVNQDPGNADPSAVDEPTDHLDPGDVPVAGERCPASRRAYNIAGGANGIPCPAKCGALISTTASGRVRDHDVPEVPHEETLEA